MDRLSLSSSAGLFRGSLLPSMSIKSLCQASSPPPHNPDQPHLKFIVQNFREAAVLNLGSWNQLMGFKDTISSLNCMQTNFYFSATVREIEKAVLGSKFPEGRTLSYTLVSPEPSTALGKTRFCLNPAVFCGVPQTHSAQSACNPSRSALWGLGDPLLSPHFLLAALLQAAAHLPYTLYPFLKLASES